MRRTKPKSFHPRLSGIPKATEGAGGEDGQEPLSSTGVYSFLRLHGVASRAAYGTRLSCRLRDGPAMLRSHHQ